MLRWARRRVRELAATDLDGFVLKGGSPSCGIDTVPVYSLIHKKGKSTSRGHGIFARAFMEHCPLIPVEGDGRLQDPQFRESFIERVFVMKEWRDAMRQHRRSPVELARFHTKNKLLIFSHSIRHHRIMGDLVARSKVMPVAALSAEYQRLLMEALRLKATPAKHVNVLQHITGYFKTQLSRDERQRLRDAIDCYRQGRAPLSVAINRINHYACLYDLACLRQQRYLHPPPLELKLRDLL